MIPHRYEGTLHALKLITKEEGIRGLYRGFIAYAIAVIRYEKYNKYNLKLQIHFCL